MYKTNKLQRYIVPHREYSHTENIVYNNFRWNIIYKNLINMLYTWNQYNIVNQLNFN